MQLYSVDCSLVTWYGHREANLNELSRLQILALNRHARLQRQRRQKGRKRLEFVEDARREIIFEFGQGPQSRAMALRRAQS